MSGSEMMRPVFHLTPSRHWMNDPNGLVHHGGRWHAYFQHNPDGIDWGNMSWGHASSTDLEHWVEHPVALAHRPGEQIYSGSVVAEPDGTLTAFYTSAFDTGRQAQSRATSRDGGFTWARDARNPVLDRGSSDFRDPKVIRYTDDDGTQRWILLAVEAVERRVLFYASADLEHWDPVGSFGPVGDDGVVWECPDLVRLRVDGDDAHRRWVLLLSTNPIGEDAAPAGSAMHYVVGDFDGRSFTADQPVLVPADHGRDMYAGVTFDSAPDGAAIMLGWMSNWRYAHAVPSAPWRGAMSLPRTLSLRTVDGAARLVQRPASFVDEYLSGAASVDLLADRPRTLTLSGHSLVELSWDPTRTGALRIRLDGEADDAAEIVHDPDAGMLTVSRTGTAAAALHPDFASTSVAPLRADDAGRLLVSLDGPLLEVFAGDGESVVSNLVTLGAGPISLTVDAAARSPIGVRSVDVDVARRSTATAAA